LYYVLCSVSENPDGWDNVTLMVVSGYDWWLTKAWMCFSLWHMKTFSVKCMYSLECCKMICWTSYFIVCKFVAQMGLWNDRDRKLTVSVSDLNRNAPYLAW